MVPDLDAFGNPIGNGPSAAPSPAPEAQAPAPQPAAPPRVPSAAPLVARRVIRIVRRFVLTAILIGGGYVAVRAVRDAASDAIPSISLPEIERPEAPAPTQSVDYSREPFAKGSMFRAGNLAAAIRRAKAKAPAGARAVSVSVFPGYAVVTFKRRSGDARSVTTWADGRVNTSDAGSATGRQTFSLGDLPLSPMVRYVRSRAQALGGGARGPYAVTIGTTTTSFVNGQVRITTRPATGWLIGFEGVPQSKRTVQIDLRGKRLR